MSLVYNDDGVGREKKIFLDLPQQDSVSHELDLCSLRDVPLVPAGKVSVWIDGGGDGDSPYLVTDYVPWDSQLLGHSLGHGGSRDSPGFRHSYPGMTAVPGLIQKLGDLGSLPTTSLA